MRRGALLSLLHLIHTEKACAARTSSHCFSSPTMMRQAAINSPTMRQAPLRNPNNLPTKICVTCNRPFTWRKKWERSWDEITTCSKRCNAERKKKNGRLGQPPDKESSGEETNVCAANGVDQPFEQDLSGEGMNILDVKAARKDAKKAAKAARRAQREGVPQTSKRKD